MSEPSVYEEQILEIYSSLWQYKDLLNGAPALEINPAEITSETRGVFMQRVEAQTKAVIAYLLGMRDAALSVASMVGAIEKHYQKDDFWRRLLVKYVQAVHAKDVAEVQSEKLIVYKQLADLQQKVAVYRQQRKEIIRSFAAAVEKEKFPVNAQKLFTNYLNMADKNPKEAWNVLISNPAYFAPIITADSDGNVVLDADAAKSQNEKLAHFLKKLKA